MRRIANIIVTVQLLVVVAGIILGAIIRLREANHQQLCASNLRQVALSVSNYSDQNGRLPPASSACDVQPPEARLSLLLELAPYMDSLNWTPGIRRNLRWDAEENLRAGNVRISCFICPGSSVEQRGGLFVTHYVGIAGLGESAAELSKEDRNAGIFGYDRFIKADDITDGLTTTLMFMETGSYNGPWFAGGHPTVRGLFPNASQGYLGRGNQFGGLHRGGTAALFADASYRFISDSIDTLVLEAMATIAGGE